MIGGMQTTDLTTRAALFRGQDQAHRRTLQQGLNFPSRKDARAGDRKTKTRLKLRYNSVRGLVERSEFARARVWGHACEPAAVEYVQEGRRERTSPWQETGPHRFHARKF